MQPRTATAPAEPVPEHEDSDPDYIWAVYPPVSRLPLVDCGTAATACAAREEAEAVMTARPAESAFAVVLAPEGDDTIGRSTSAGSYRWAPFCSTRPQP